MTVDVRLLPPFLAVAERLSFTRAAEDLSISQPRLSLLIRRLEDHLGFALFVRRPHHVALTDDGARFLAEARELSDALRRTNEMVWRLRDAARSKLRLGSPSFSRDVPARVELVDEFAVRHPNLKLEIEDGYTPRLLERLRQGRLDLTLASAPFDDHGLEWVQLSASQPMIATPAESRLARLESIGAEDLSGVAFAVFPNYIGAHYVQAWHQPLQRAGAVLVESNEPHYGIQIRFAARRRLCTLVHRWPGRIREPNDGFPDMVLRPIRGFSLGSRLCLVRKAGAPIAPVQWMWDLAGSLAEPRPAIAS
ncbi:MAG: cmpR [Caulobacter sp.]|nr:cmpR [Caulobacter sp.]